MRIQNDQLSRLVADNESMLRLAIGNLVREEQPYLVQALPNDLFEEMIGNGLTTARGYGLQAAQELATFVLLMFEFGPEFHRHPLISRVLRDASSAPPVRLDAVVNDTPNEVWREITAALDRQTWFPEQRVPEAEG